jgi:hypothetical protein
VINSGVVKTISGIGDKSSKTVDDLIDGVNLAGAIAVDGVP